MSTAAAPPRRTWSDRFSRLTMRLLKFGLVSTLLVILVAEMASHGLQEKPPMYSWVGWVQFATSLFAIGVYVWYRPGRKRWIAAVSVASLVVTGVDVLYDQAERGVGTAELLSLGLLMLFAVRHWDAAPGRWVAFATGTAVMVIGARLFVVEGSQVAGTVMILMAMTSVVGFGAYLRSMDRLRRETQEEVRRAERLELAREMHDFVAHHVTGMVVLAQAAQVTDTDPRKAFADIEEAGLSALASMRRMVGMLRGADGAGANPLGDLSQIHDLVERFSREGTDASCFISPELGEGVAPEIAATAHRVVREALTNVRKHAKDATRVRVVVAAAGGQGLEVSVRDDGRPAKGRLSESGAGLGLLGLGERVEAVGGQLRAQRRPEGGWETTAWLPRVSAALVE